MKAKSFVRMGDMMAEQLFESLKQGDERAYVTAVSIGGFNNVAKRRRF